jgi:uncharacterized protein
MSWIDVHPAERPRYVDELELDALEPGRIHRLALRLIEDGAARSLRVPLLVARGLEPGPTVGLTAAIHGNELNGIPAIHSLFRRIDPKELSGTVVGLSIANMPAYTRHRRRYPDEEDLNRVFPGRADGNESQVYAWRLLDKVIRYLDVLLDLHTASFGRVNAFYVRADLSRPATADLARRVGAEIVVQNPSKDATLRGAAEDLGIPAITVEIGDPHIFDQDMVRASRVGLRDILEHLAMLRPDEEEATGHAVECIRSYWLYTDTGGLLTVIPEVARRVKRGQSIARLVDPWGQLLRVYRAPEDGIVIGKSANPVGRTGARILHLGIEGQVALATPEAG